MNVTVYGGAHPGSDPAYVKAAEDLGRLLARGGHTVVYGGGAIGMMGGLSHGALEEGGSVIGVIPRFMVEREWANPRVADMRMTETMAERKTMMLELGDVFVAMPGGTGTLEEITEALSRCNLGLMHTKCIFLNIGGYYEPLRTMLQAMYEADYLAGHELANAVFADSVDELEGILKEISPQREDAHPDGEVDE